MSRIYLDSSILLSSVIDKPTEKKRSKNMIETLRAGHNIVIPQIVLAEIVSKILTHNNNYQKLLQDISNVILNITNPHTCIPNADEKVYDLALSIVRNDNRIDICDATIVAQAILDNADILLTYDTKILESEYIIFKLIPAYGGRLEIKDRFP